jgi:purine nucleosidase
VRPFLIDTDPGVDDALAILMCFAAPDIQVRALTVLGGNVGLMHTVRNACHLVDQSAANSNVKVYAGVARPFLADLVDAAFVHGSDGFGDANLAAPITQLETLHAALAIIEHANACDGQLEILALGPLTNIALALALDPSLPSKVKRLVIMGGAITAKGNITAFAEFNIAVDPHAAQSVFQRWPNAELVDWEATVRYAPSIATTESWLAGQSCNAQLMHSISRKTLIFNRSIAGDLRDAARWTWADPLAAFVAIQPERCQFQTFGVEVMLHGTAVGATLLNERGDNVRVMTELNKAEFHASLQQCLSKMPN